MKPLYTLGVGSLLLTMTLSVPAVAGEQSAQSQEGQQTQMSGKTPGAGQSQMKNLTADEIADAKVVNDSGEQIGRIDSVVRDKQSQDLYAVVSVGGFLGVAAKEVTIPLRDLSVQGDNLLAPPLASTEEALKSWPEYAKDEYDQIAGTQQLDLPVTDGATSMGERGGEHASFADLDKDINGYVDKSEAKDNPALTEHWQNLDKNGDDRLDQSEFAAFEMDESNETPGIEDQQPEEGGMSPHKSDQDLPKAY